MTALEGHDPAGSPSTSSAASLAGASRAIARDPEGRSGLRLRAAARPSGKTARVAFAGPSLEPRLVAEARGAADSRGAPAAPP